MRKPKDYVEKYGLPGRKKKAIGLLDQLGDRYIQKQVLANKWPAICATLGTDEEVTKPKYSQAQESVVHQSKELQQSTNSSAPTGQSSNSRAISRKRPFEDSADPSLQAPVSKRPRLPIKSTDIIEISD